MKYLFKKMEGLFYCLHKSFFNWREMIPVFDNQAMIDFNIFIANWNFGK